MKGRNSTNSSFRIQYKYTDYLPVYDEKTHFDPLEPFEFKDRGLEAEKAKPNLLSTSISNLRVTRLTPRIGTELRGLQLSELNDAQKNELALLIAERGVVVVRPGQGPPPTCFLMQTSLIS